MNTCKKCGNEFNPHGEDYYEDLCEQADALGVDSLTENQQLVLKGSLCEECYEI